MGLCEGVAAGCTGKTGGLEGVSAGCTGERLGAVTDGTCAGETDSEGEMDGETKGETEGEIEGTGDGGSFGSGDAQACPDNCPIQQLSEQLLGYSSQSRESDITSTATPSAPSTQRAKPFQLALLSNSPIPIISEIASASTQKPPSGYCLYFNFYQEKNSSTAAVLILPDCAQSQSLLLRRAESSGYLPPL